ncbi:uncharacterized protein LOC142357936 [Convolutriloba macropyga]|uniref:uncharacterized protein LOC142357936 n=1 Tax=Convolutriloba macropyga TaxID=536237 RepID=UPI003F520578
MDLAPASIASVRDESMDAVRLDINDLQGEACLLRFPEAGEPAPPRWEDVVGAEDESQKTCRLMDGTLLVRVCCPEGERAGDIKPRLLKLEDNPLVLPLPPPVKDPVGHDINEIPAALNAVQKDWASSGSVNRLSACTLSRQVLRRLSELHAQGTQQNRSIDILVTGCEVSLWVGEQFAADLHRVFPRLTVRALSANKILGLLGHNYPVPQTGFKLEAENLDLTDSIVIIISHSGGTFAPLAISKLLQAVTNNIFVVTSEWDTQISRQLRSLESWAARSRIFSTGVGLRSAEPCSISLAATHQLLTQILLQLMLTVQSNHMALVTSGAAFIPDDLQQLARLNQDSISGIEEIVGVLRTGVVAPCSEVMLQLRALGGRWSQHVLEAPIAWILTAVYVIFTVTFSLPVATAVTTLIAGSDVYGAAVWRYFVMFADSLIFLFFPQLATWLIRLVQRRPLMHRMAHRTVVIGDIPWVAQSIEAFLSKLFASAYSNASVTVFSANPADHLVHRLTHRIARGTLLAVGRPDGRLSALSSAENAALLSVSQASSIQNLGHACCESLTIGHNAFKLPLSKFAVFLPSHRPRYICETDTVHGRGSDGSTVGPSASDTSQHLDSGPGAAIPSPPISPAGGMPAHRGPASPIRRHKSAGCAGPLENNSGRRDLKRDTPAILGFGHRVAGPKRSSENGCEHHNGQLSPGTSQRGASSSQLLGAFENIRKQDMKRDVSAVISSGQRLTHSNRSERSSGSERIRPLHGGRSRVEGHATPHANAGTGSSQKGIASGLLNIVHSRRSTERTRSQATAKHLSPQGGTPMDVKSTSIYVRHSMELISRAAVPSELTFVDEVRTAMQDRPELSTVSAQKQALLGMVEPSIEEVFGDNLMKTCPDAPIARLIIEQTLSCELYESRVASLQRLVAFFVMFHEMGKRVQDFWPRVSFGMLGYGMDRTHSVMRVATTASPVSAVEVNERIWELRLARAARKARDGFMRLLQADHSTDVLPP